MQLTVHAKGNTRPITAAVLVVLAVSAFVPMSGQHLYMVTLASVYAIAAVGLDILSGYAGLVSVGQFALAAAGGYVGTIFATTHDVSPALSGLIAVAFAALVSLVFGAVFVRLAHFGFAIATFFLSAIAVTALSGDTFAKYTNSESGLLGPQPWTPATLYLIVLACLAVVLILSQNYVNSQSGRALRMIKHNESIAAVQGIGVYRAKLGAFVFAGACAGLAGYLMAVTVGSIVPESFGPVQSIELYAMATVGGLGTIAGPILGCFFFVFGEQTFQFGGASQDIFFAATLIVVLVAAPDGIYGLIERLVRLIGRTRAVTALVDRAGKCLPKRRPGVQRQPSTALLDEGIRAKATGHEVLRVVGLGVSFGGVVALHEVNCTFTPGTIHAVIGPNGAGKTTLLNCISGLQRPTSGEVTQRGVRLDQLRPQRIRAEGVVRTFQNSSLVLEMTALENVEVGCHALEHASLLRDLVGYPLTHRRQQRITEMAHAALDLVDFPIARRSVHAAELSLGEQKIVDVARALVGQASVLLLDEPTAGLSEDDIEVLSEALLRLRRTSDICMIVIAHHVGFVKKIADVVTVLDTGSCLAQGAPADVLEQQEVVSAFLGGDARFAPDDLFASEVEL